MGSSRGEALTESRRLGAPPFAKNVATSTVISPRERFLGLGQCAAGRQAIP
jgi:hypothetical protein